MLINGFSSAFHSQFEYLSFSQSRPGQHASQYDQNFDMSAMAGALPQPGHSHTQPSGNFGPLDMSGVPQSYYPMQHPQQFQAGRGISPQQAYQQYGQSGPTPMMARPQLPYPPPGPYGSYEQYTYNIPPQFQMPPVDPRFGHNNSFGVHSMSPQDHGQFARRASEPAAPIPSFPRGPPRKPKQSGHALWVGNLPPAATITDLKDHFSREATKDIESLFLISKSNCAFVNYRSEAACVAAMNRFHDSRFHGVRLVCRLRRGAATGLSSSPVGDLPETPENPTPSDSLAASEQPSSPTIVGTPQQLMLSTQPASMLGSSDDSPRISEKYFVVKSLTVQDLEASVRNGIWATQSHNEDALNRAYEETDNVYLIFSANKSGEYFGYARMASTISGEPVNLSSTFTQTETRSSGVPHSIITPATATAPKGRIIDDSARGSIFWEAEPSDDDDEGSPTKDGSEPSDGQNWGRQFSIEWQSTAKLPFYRTRGLRNPWNANREVKIARDGTEIEPSVGRRLIQMFHRPSPTPGPPPGTVQFR